MNIALSLSNLAVKLLYLLKAERILQTFHTHAVLNLGKKIFRAAAHAHRRRVGRYELGVFLLYRLELALEHIIFIVVDLRIVVNVIFFAVVVELFTELRSAFSAELLILQQKHPPWNFS